MKKRTLRLLRRSLAVMMLLMALALTLILATVGCMIVTPLPPKSTVPERLAMFPADGVPVRGKVVIYWDRHMIPFIEAEHDEDLALVLGMVHAHLRLGQMAFLRRASQGRLAEMFGPPVADIDHALRLLDLPRAAPAIKERLPAETRSWLENFVGGINLYQERMTREPHEFAVLGIEPTPWTVEDVIALERLSGVDVNWLAWFMLLRARGTPVVSGEQAAAALKLAAAICRQIRNSDRRQTPDAS